MKISPLYTLLSLVPAVSGLSCHGNSHFRLGTIQQSDHHSKLSEADLVDKSEACWFVWGLGGKLFDLELMEGEFPNPTDLQHALNPLFKENPQAEYYVADHGADRQGEHKYILKYLPKDEEATQSMRRVSGQIFLDLRPDEGDEETDLLCYIPRQEYANSTQGESSSSSWMQCSLAIVAVLALGLALIEMYKTKKAMADPASRPAGTFDLGGAYSVLSSTDNDLTKQLAPAKVELV